MADQYSTCLTKPPSLPPGSTRRHWTGSVTIGAIWLALLISDSIHAQNADKFLDDLLKNAKNTTKIRALLDPLRLEDTELKKILVYNVTIHNLLSLTRQGPAVFSSKRQNVTMDAALAFSDVLVEANFRLKRESKLLRLRGSVSALVERLVAKISIHANIFAGSVSLARFTVTELGHLRVTKVTGAGALNKLAQTFAQKVLVDRNRARIRQAIEDRGKEAIEHALQQADITSLL